MLLFRDDIKPVSNEQVALINHATGKRHLAPDKALLKAQSVSRMTPESAMRLVEHPDPRVPLALAQNRNIKWSHAENRVLWVALRNRAILDAAADGAIWTPLLDATKEGDRNYVSSMRLHVYGKNEIMVDGYGWASGGQGPDRKNDPFLNGPYSNSVEHLWASDATLAYKFKIASDDIWDKCVQEYNNLVFWQLVAKICPERLDWQKIGPGATAGYNRAVLEYGFVPKAARLDMLGAMLAGKYEVGLVIDDVPWGLNHCVTAYLGSKPDVERLIDGWDKIQETGGAQVSIEAYCRYCFYRSAGIKDVDKVIRFLLRVSNGVLPGNMARAVGNLVGRSTLEVRSAEALLKLFPGSVMRLALSRGPARANSEIARLLAKSVNPGVLSNIAQGDTDSVLAVFDNMVKIVPDAAAYAVEKNVDVVEKLTSKQLAPLLAIGDQELSRRIIGKIKDSNGDRKGRGR